MIPRKFWIKNIMSLCRCQRTLKYDKLGYVRAWSTLLTASPISPARHWRPRIPGRWNLNITQFRYSFPFSSIRYKPTHHISTSLTLQVYYGPEPDFWMVLTVGIPGKGCRFVSNLTLRSLLVTSYRLFTLFYGSLGQLMNKLEDTAAFRVGFNCFQHSLCVR